MIVCCRFLVEHGADIAAVNNEGELPLDLAEEDEMEEYLQDQLRKASKQCSILFRLSVRTCQELLAYCMQQNKHA